MNAKAERNGWLPIVEQCEAQGGTVANLPSLEGQLGRGSWRIYPGTVRADGTVLHTLYWCIREGGTRKETRIGSFYRTGKRQPQERTNAQTDMLTIGWDSCGRRIMQCPSLGGEAVVVHMDAIGPYPVPVRTDVAL